MRNGPRAAAHHNRTALEPRVLRVLICLRTNLTTRALAALVGTRRSTIRSINPPRATHAAPVSYLGRHGVCRIPQGQSPNPLNTGPAMTHHTHPNQGDPAPFPAGPTLNNVVFSSPEPPVTT
jgi:hypothetical protein